MSSAEIRNQIAEVLGNRGHLDVWWIQCDGNKKIVALALSALDLLNELERLSLDKGKKEEIRKGSF